MIRWKTCLDGFLRRHNSVIYTILYFVTTIFRLVLDGSLMHFETTVWCHKLSSFMMSVACIFSDDTDLSSHLTKA